MAVRQVCEANKSLRACYLLDARKAEGAELKLVIALLMDDESKNMDKVVVQLQEMLLEFPTLAQKTAIMSAESFVSDWAGAEFYQREGCTFPKASPDHSSLSALSELRSRADEVFSS